MGKLDNTLIIYISGDNGTSAEGTLEGTFNQMTAYNGVLTLPEAGSCCIMKIGVQTRPTRICRWHGRGRLIRPSSGPSRWRRISVGPRTSRKTTTWPRRIPNKLKELQALFQDGGGEYNVLPLDNSILPRL